MKTDQTIISGIKCNLLRGDTGGRITTTWGYGKEYVVLNYWATIDMLVEFVNLN